MTWRPGDLVRAIEAYNTDPELHTILVWHPTPAGIDHPAAIPAIDPARDVDGPHPENLAGSPSSSPNARCEEGTLSIVFCCTGGPSLHSMQRIDGARRW